MSNTTMNTSISDLSSPIYITLTMSILSVILHIALYIYMYMMNCQGKIRTIQIGKNIKIDLTGDEHIKKSGVESKNENIPIPSESGIQNLNSIISN